MTDNDFHARRTELSNTFAAAGAELLDYMGCAGALAAIPSTQQYVVAGDIAAIRAQLDTVAPQRRMRHGDRPEQPLYFGPEAGQPRRWAALITSAGHGILQEYGTAFEHAQPGQEVLEVMEILPGAPAIANKATEEGELPLDLMKQVIRDALGNTHIEDGTVAAFDQVVDELAIAVLAADRASRQVANKAEVEPIAHLKFWASQSWSGNGNHGVEHGEGLEVCQPGEIGDDGKPAFPVFAAPPAPVGAVPSIGTNEFGDLLANLWNAPSIGERDERARAVIAHIDQHVAREVAAQASQVTVPGWISVDERLPDAGHCLATYRNQHGKLRIIRAKYARQFEIDAGEDAIDQGNCEYNEADDTFYLKAGWLECIDNWDDYSSIYVTEGEVTHWMPLPAAPSPAKESK